MLFLPNDRFRSGLSRMSLGKHGLMWGVFVVYPAKKYSNSQGLGCRTETLLNPNQIGPYRLKDLCREEAPIVRFSRFGRPHRSGR